MRKKQAAPSDRQHGRLRLIVVRRQSDPLRPHLARVHAGPVTLQAALGRAGVTHRKREGDMSTPVGRFELRRGYFRADRLPRTSGPALLKLTTEMGWCDDVSSGRYNRLIPAGSRERHERLWRQDGVYDILLTTSHNERPRIRGAGSAIFVHLARPGYHPTEGCVAVSLTDMRRLLPRLGARVLIKVVG